MTYVVNRLASHWLAIILAVLSSLVGSNDSGAATRHAAGERTLHFSHPSAAVRSGGDATIHALLWYPAAAASAEQAVVIGAPDRPVFLAGRVAAAAAWVEGSPRPLVLLSHGFGGVARQMTWLGAALARAGYVVLAVDHPGTNGRDGITAQGAYAPWERALDLRVALDSALADPTLAARIDATRIAVVGFSLGGWTAALLAGARADFAAFDRFCAGPARDSICEPQREYPLDFGRRHPVLRQPAMAPLAARERADHRDPRVRAAFLIAPALAQALDRATLRAVRIPLAVLVGADDTITRPPTNAAVFADLVPGATLTTLPGVAHYDFLSECGDEGRRIAAPYCTDGDSRRRADTHATTIASVTRFLHAVLR